VTEKTAQETLQPLYLLCDGSVRMRDEDLAVANLLAGHLADEIAGDPLLARSVRWGIELYGSGDRTSTLMPLRQVDPVTSVPQIVTMIEEPALGAALPALRRRISDDLARLRTGATDVRAPLVAVLTSGHSADSAQDRANGLATLLGADPRTSVLLVTPPGTGPDIATVPAGGHQVDLARLDGPDDVADLARWISRALRQSVEHGISRLDHARWVVREHELGRLTATTRPFELRRLDDAPFGELLGLVALRGDPATATLRRSLRWPYRLVAGDQPETAVGLLLPAVPERFTTVDDHGRRTPRPISAITSGPPVSRARLCAALAGTVHLAHRHGLVLGEDALASALHTPGADPEVLIADCAGVRLHGPGGRDRQVTDLAWLGRFVGHCAQLPDPTGGTPLLDAIGRELLRRALSRHTGPLPTAAEWRDHLTERAITLQGPPVIEQIQVSPEIVPVGSPVTVRWRGRHATQLQIIGPDGAAVTAADNELDDGRAQLIMMRPGPIRLRAANPAGVHQAETGHVHVFDLPRLAGLALPEPAAESRAGYALPAFPPVAVPAPPSGVLRVTGFPIDVARWFDARPERPRRRWPRWLRKPWA
jgi:uncharacterized protein YegL